MIQIFDDFALSHTVLSEPEPWSGDWASPAGTGGWHWRDETALTLPETPDVTADADMAWMVGFAAKAGLSPQSGAGADDGEVADLDDVIVTGEPWHFPMLVPYSPGGGGNPTGGGDPGGGGGVSGPSGPDVSGLDGHQGVDCATNDIRDDINSKATNNNSEHVGIVFRGADGKYYASPGFTGASGQVDYQQLGQWMTSRNIGFADIVVLYHNHDQASSTNPDPDLHRYPSNQNTVSPGGNYDWLAADGFVAAGVNPHTFALAIEDQNGVVRYFDYDDKQDYENMTRQDMEDRDDLPAPVGGCGG